MFVPYINFLKIIQHFVLRFNNISSNLILRKQQDFHHSADKLPKSDFFDGFRRQNRCGFYDFSVGKIGDGADLRARLNGCLHPGFERNLFLDRADFRLRQDFGHGRFDPFDAVPQAARHFYGSEFLFRVPIDPPVRESPIKEFLRVRIAVVA